MDISQPESIYNPRIVEMDMYFIGTDREDAVERFKVFEWSEDAENYVDDHSGPEGEPFHVFEMKVEVNLTKSKKVYTAGDFDRAVGRID